MQRFGFLALSGLSLALLLFVIACGQAGAPAPATSPSPVSAPISPVFPLAITDGHGEQVILERPPERIVAIDSATVEMLFLVGEGRRVVGAHRFVTFPPETKDIEKIGDAFNINFEKVAVLKPDLIAIFFDRFLPDLRRLGIPVLYLKSPATLVEVADRMRLWGKIVNKPQEGEQLARQFEEAIALVKQETAGVKEGPRVYHDAAPEMWTSGSGSLESEMYTLLKARNIFGDISGFKQVSVEDLVSRDPQVIVSVYPEGPTLLKTDPRFKNVSAVKEGRICAVEEDVLSVPGPRLVQGIRDIAKCLYPELFR